MNAECLWSAAPCRRFSSPGLRSPRRPAQEDPFSLRRTPGLGGVLFLLSLVISLLPAAHAATAPSHPFACADYSQGKVFVIDSNGSIEWEYQTASCNDLWVLPNGNLLFNTGHGVREVTRDRKVVFDYQSKSEIYACQRLPNGNTFIGECNAGRLLEVDPSTNIVRQLRLLPEGTDGGHVYMRNARQLSNGHYLVTHFGEQVVREYRPDGTTVLSIPAAGGPHSAARLPNGNTVITCGDMPGGSRVFEADTTGKCIWEVKDGDLPGVGLKFIAGFQRLPNGNTVIANWLGHGQFGKAPHILEITHDKQVVWSFTDHKNLRTVASLQLLDVPGDVIQGQIIH